MAIVVRPSPIHSVGVYTSTPIRKGTRIVEYDGPRISAEEADRPKSGSTARARRKRGAMGIAIPNPAMGERKNVSL